MTMSAEQKAIMKQLTCLLKENGKLSSFAELEGCTTEFRKGITIYLFAKNNLVQRSGWIGVQRTEPCVKVQAKPNSRYNSILYWYY
jgi:hypothetical protein